MIEIRQASTPDDLQAVYRFRYAVYVEEMAWKMKHVNHTTKLLIDPLDVPGALEADLTRRESFDAWALAAELRRETVGPHRRWLDDMVVDADDAGERVRPAGMRCVACAHGWVCHQPVLPPTDGGCRFVWVPVARRQSNTPKRLDMPKSLDILGGTVKLRRCRRRRRQ